MTISPFVDPFFGTAALAVICIGGWLIRRALKRIERKLDELDGKVQGVDVRLRKATSGK